MHPSVAHKEGSTHSDDNLFPNALIQQDTDNSATANSSVPSGLQSTGNNDSLPSTSMLVCVKLLPITIGVLLFASCYKY